MVRRAPAAADLERVFEEAHNAMVAARSDAARWVSSGPPGEFAGRQRVELLAAESLVQLADALRILRSEHLAEEHRHPRPPTPLRPDVA